MGRGKLGPLSLVVVCGLQRGSRSVADSRATRPPPRTRCQRSASSLRACGRRPPSGCGIGGHRSSRRTRQQATSAGSGSSGGATAPSSSSARAARGTSCRIASAARSSGNSRLPGTPTARSSRGLPPEARPLAAVRYRLGLEPVAAHGATSAPMRWSDPHISAQSAATQEGKEIKDRNQYRGLPGSASKSARRSTPLWP